MESPELFIALNLLLAVYLGWNCLRVFQKGRYAWLQPPVLASILHFGIQYIFPNLRYVASDEWYELSHHLPQNEIFTELNTAMLAIIVAAFGLWNGYNSRLSNSISAFLSEQLKKIAIMRQDFEINFWFLLVLIGLCISAPIIQIQLGIFGYFSDGKGLIDAQPIAQWINLLSSAGKLALLVLAISVFSPRYRHHQIARVLFLFLLLFHIFTGLIGGFKSQVFVPFLFLGVAYYLVNRKISFQILLMAVAALVLSYLLIEPLRRSRFADPTLNNREVGSVVSVAVKSFAETFTSLQNSQASGDFSLYKLQQRVDLTTVTALALRYADSGRLDVDSAPRFLQNLMLVPLHAFVPRFLWEEKALANDGWWFSVYVLDRPFDTISSTAMGPVSYLYFAGGTWGVLLGFWCIGLFQRVHFLTFARGQIGSWIVYLGVLFPIVTIESNVAASGAGVIRLIPFLLIAQSLVVKRSSRGLGN